MKIHTYIVLYSDSEKLELTGRREIDADEIIATDNLIQFLREGKIIYMINPRRVISVDTKNVDDLNEAVTTLKTIQIRPKRVGLG